MKVLKKLTLSLMLALVAGIVIKSAPDVMRYLKIRDM